MRALMDVLSREGSYVAVYDNAESVSKFKFGRVLCVNDYQFVMLMLSPNGNYDGIVVDDTEDIFRIDTCGRYHEKMAKLHSLQNENIVLPHFDSACINVSVLTYAKETKRLVSIEFYKSGVFDVVGFVDEVTENTCRIHLINEYGEEDGYSCIDMDSISQISCDSEEEQRVMRLYQLNN